MLHFRESMEGMANEIEYTALEMVELARQRVYDLDAEIAMDTGCVDCVGCEDIYNAIRKGE